MCSYFFLYVHLKISSNLFLFYLFCLKIVTRFNMSVSLIVQSLCELKKSLVWIKMNNCNRITHFLCQSIFLLIMKSNISFFKKLSVNEEKIK